MAKIKINLDFYNIEDPWITPFVLCKTAEYNLSEVIIALKEKNDLKVILPNAGPISVKDDMVFIVFRTKPIFLP